MVEAQGGDVSLIVDTEKFRKAKYRQEVLSPADGYISATDAENIGSASVVLGAGRATKDDAIDYTAGIILHKKTGDKVEKGEVIAELFTDDEGRFASAVEMFMSGLVFSEKEAERKPLIYKVVE